MINFYMFQFNPSVPISQEIAGFKKNPTLKDRIHCVCIVIDGSTAGVLPEKLLEKIKAIQTKMNVRCTYTLHSNFNGSSIDGSFTTAV